MFRWFFFFIPFHFAILLYHSTIERVHRLSQIIRQSLEETNVCLAAFLDLQQAFDKVWHQRPLYKLNKILYHSFYNLFE